MNFEAVLHYKHQNKGHDEKKKLRHASGASANNEASNRDSEADSTEHSPVPSPEQKKINEVSNKPKPGINTEVLLEACVWIFTSIHLYCIFKQLVNNFLKQVNRFKFGQQ